MYGIFRVSNSIQKSFSSSLRTLIEKAVDKPIKGVLIGTLVTSIIQSSSATTVIVIGLVNAGIITFYNALGIIFGANIGTTITAQLVAFKLTKLAVYFMIIGFFLMFFGKGKQRNVGEAMFYFGLLFYGLNIMEHSLRPLKDNPAFTRMLLRVKNPILGILIGAVFTGIVQSSSVTTSIVVVLGQQGLISLASAIPIILGANIGTTVTALIASINTSLNARRSAIAHFFFNVIGVLLFLPLLKPFEHLLLLITPNLGKQIAMGHTLFNITNTIIALLLIQQFHKLIKKIVPGEEHEVKFGPQYINKKLCKNPIIGLELAKKEIIRMASLSKEMLVKSREIILNKKIKNKRFIENTELVVDDLQKQTTKFLTELSKKELSQKDAKQLSAFLAMINDIERIADHAENLMKLGEQITNENLKFSKYAMKELTEIYELAIKNVSDSEKLIIKYSRETASRIKQREEEIDKLTKEAYSSHIRRLHTGICNVYAGAIYTDILNNLERVSDHCMNIKEAVESYEEKNNNS